jgi:hypothetical protein
MNPSMLTSEGEVNAVLPADWTAAPDLKSFVSNGASSGGLYGAAPSAPAASASSSAGVDAAAAAGSTSGAGKSL